MSSQPNERQASQLPAQVDTPLEHLNARQRDHAKERLAMITPALERIQTGVSISQAAEWLAARGEGKSAATYCRWIQTYLTDGLAGLAPAYKGRTAREFGWEGRAVELFQEPVRRNMGEVADKLVQEGFEQVSYSRVRRYLKSLPVSVTVANRKRLGPNFHRNNVALHKVRDVSDLMPGEAWMSDGNCLPVISRDRASGEFHRLELTPILDVRTNLLMAWAWSRAESAESTIYAFCSAARLWGGFPVWFYSDVGSGFDNSRTQALFQRAGTTHVRSLPGTPKSKGFGEGFFKLVRGRFAKNFASYCGTERTDDLIARFRTKHRRGELYVPYDDEVMAAFVAWADHYNKTQQPYSERIKNQAPIEFAGQLQLAPIHLSLVELIRPEAEATVQRGMVRLNNRRYADAVLADYETQRIRVQWDQHDESVVWLFDADGRFLAEAQLIDKVPWARESAAADAREKSMLAAVARKETQIEQIKNLHAGAIEGEVSPAAELMATPSLAARPAPQAIEAPKLSPSAELLLKELRNKPAQARRRGASGTTAAEERSARWQRACELEAALAQGDEISEADAAWLGRYQQLPEYRTQQHIQNKKARSVGSTPGLDSGAVRATPSHVRIQNDQRGDHDE